jgi:hypothetical protein
VPAWARSAQGRALAAGIGAALVLVVVLALWAHRRSQSRAHLRALHWVTAPAPLLLAEEALSDVAAPEDGVVHLAVLQPADGQLVARVPVGMRLSFVGGASSGLWFNEPGGLGVHRRDARTLEVSVTEDAWRDKNLGVPSVVRVEGPLDPAHGIPLLFSDGKSQWLDPDTLSVRPVREEINQTWLLRPSVALFDTHRGKAPQVHIGRLHGQAAFVDLPHGRAIQCSGQRLSSQVFNDPVFLTEAEDKSGLLLDGPSFLVLDRASARGEGAWAVSRVNCDGMARWSLLLRDPDVAGTLRDHDVVYLVTRSTADQDSVRAVDLSSGAVLWTYP